MVLRDTRADRVAFGMIGVEEIFRRCPLDHLRQLPPRAHRVLHARLETLAAVGGCTCAASPAINTRRKERGGGCGPPPQYIRLKGERSGRDL